MKNPLLLFASILFAFLFCNSSTVIDLVYAPADEESTVTKGEESSLLVGSFNIRYYNTTDPYPWSARKDASMNFIKDKKPDFLGLQEVCSPQAQDFINELSSDYGYYDINRDTGSSISGNRGEGVAILYRNDRFTIADKGFFWLADPSDELPKQNSDGTYSSWNSACRRIVIWVEAVDMHHDNQTVWFFVTHFDHVSSAARLNSSKLTVSKIHEITGVSDFANSNVPIFLVGDLNCTYSSVELSPLRSSMSDARTTAAVSESEQRTYNAFAEKEKEGPIIDHIFYVGNISADVFDVVTEDYGVAYISDHYPVLFRNTYQ